MSSLRSDERVFSSSTGTANDLRVVWDRQDYAYITNFIPAVDVVAQDSQKTGFLSARVLNGKEQSLSLWRPLAKNWEWHKRDFNTSDPGDR